MFNIQETKAMTVFGVPDCGEWIHHQNASYKAWLLGYLSGINAAYNGAKIDHLAQLSSAGQAFLWMDNYCRRNPLSNVDLGAAALFYELTDRKKALTTKP